MKKLLTLLSSILFFTALSFAQIIGVDSTGQNLNSLPDTIFLNDNYSHNILVKNFSTTQLNGTIRLMGGIDSAGTFISVDTLGVKSVASFGLNDTVSFNYSEIYNFFNSYKLGGNIVVVWPIASFGTTKDTLSKPVYIRAPASIKTLKEKSINIYPNPFKEKIFITTSDKKEIDQINIFDVSGKLIRMKKYADFFNLSNEKSGLYFIQIFFKNAEPLYYKIIKE